MQPRSQRQSKLQPNNTAAPSNGGVKPKVGSARPSVKVRSARASVNNTSAGGSGNVNSAESPPVLKRGVSFLAEEESQEDKHDKAVRALFEKIDTNNDKTLTFAELQSGLSDWGFEDVSISPSAFCVLGPERLGAENH